MKLVIFSIVVYITLANTVNKILFYVVHADIPKYS